MNNAKPKNQSQNKGQNPDARTPRAAPRRLVAMHLAESLLQGETGRDQAGRDEVIATALMTGQWLADAGRAGRWDLIDLPALIEDMGFIDDRDRDGFMLHFVGLVGHAAHMGWIPVSVVQRYLDHLSQIETTSPAGQFVQYAAAHFGSQTFSPARARA